MGASVSVEMAEWPRTAQGQNQCWAPAAFLADIGNDIVDGKGNEIAPQPRSH